MNEEQLIATLQACYFGDKGAFNKILKEYKQLQQENQQLKKRVAELTNDWNEQAKLTNQENLDCSKYAVENQQLKEKVEWYEKENRHNQEIIIKYAKVLDEIREYVIKHRQIYDIDGSIEKQIDEFDILASPKRILEIIDKVNNEPSINR